ncbi:MAG: class I SAM-dependent RNA methyltransferase [Sneathiella sp.]|nr:class I SAM-dependent RNA methyltransferase [Sneathiella sp.]
MLKLTIDHIGSNGDGVAIKDDRPYYVPFTAPGDIITATVKEERGRGFIAELEELQTPSPLRRKAACKHFMTCGGCSLQHLDDATLANWKKDRITEPLVRANVDFDTIEDTLTSPQGSRRRVEFVAAKRKKGVMIGYHLKKSHQIFDVGECPILSPDLLALVKPLRLMLPIIMARNSEARLILTSTVNGPDLLISANIELDLEVREVLADFCQKHSLSRITLRNEKERFEEKVVTRKPTAIKIENFDAEVPPGGFLQATEEGQETLISLMKQYLSKNKNVVDLFSGCGSFTLPAGATSKKVEAFEGNEDMVAALQKSANKHMLPIVAQYRDLFRRPLIFDELNKFDTAIIDPPRAGATAQVAELAMSKISTIIFISCNPNSFARDAKLLLDGGYQLKKVIPIDQFLWSPHVELFSIFEKPNS